MQTFYRIIQTILKAKNIFFPDKEDGGFTFWNNVFQREPHDKNLIFNNQSTENLTIEEYNHLVSANNLTKQSFYFMISAIDKKLQVPYYSQRAIKAKFFELNSMLNNMFMSKANKENILDIFCKCQRVYWGFSRLAFVYKYKKAKMQITCDLYMNDILTHQENSILVFQNNAKYTFIIQDLIKIINNALTNAPSFFLDPLQSKNPYTNIPFNRSTLYHIYFQMKDRVCVMPDLFHRFFLSSFNLVKFKLNNETFIKEIVFKNYINNASRQIVCADIRLMLEENKYTRRLIIDDSFPEKKLIEVFSPYLELYYHGLYCCAEEKKYLVKDILDKKLFGFYKSNKLFGRKTYTKVFKLGMTHRKYTTSFNDFYTPFSQIKIKTWENMDEDWSFINEDFNNNDDMSIDTDDDNNNDNNYNNDDDNDDDDNDDDDDDNDDDDDDDDNDDDDDDNDDDDNDNVYNNLLDDQDSSPLSNATSINESLNNLPDAQNNQEDSDEDNYDQALINIVVAIELEITEDSHEDNSANNFFNYESDTDSIS